jgi:hypothetical protein
MLKNQNKHIFIGFIYTNQFTTIGNNILYNWILSKNSYIVQLLVALYIRLYF